MGPFQCAPGILLMFESCPDSFCMAASPGLSPGTPISSQGGPSLLLHSGHCLERGGLPESADEDFQMGFFLLSEEMKHL